ncbi:ATP-binding protein [Thiolapillus sp.]
MSSIHLRLLLVATLVLAGFIGVTGWALENAFREASKTALQEKLQSHVYALLAAADVDAEGKMRLPEHLPEPRFSRPDSGLYAFVTTPDGNLFWRSRSALGLEIADAPSVAPGQTRFQRSNAMFLFSHGVEWEDDSGANQAFTFNVAEQVQSFDRQLGRFRLSLWSWLAALAAALLLVQALVLRWGLRPLRQVEMDLKAIQDGQAQRLQNVYPRELQGLTSSLNALMEHAKAVQERYRNRLDDLVHSLKTPLAYLAALLQDPDTSDDQLRAKTMEQLQRMDHIVQHQLRRAAVAARTTLVNPVAVTAVTERLLTALEKIYAHRELAVIRSLNAAAVFHGDEADLMEVLGNLLENAFKYAKTEVRVSVDIEEGLLIIIEDDGAGISPEQWETVLQRGRRADETVSGQGIGLAVVKEIITLYGGVLEAMKAESGGLRLRLHFPHEDPMRIPNT